MLLKQIASNVNIFDCYILHNIYHLKKHVANVCKNDPKSMLNFLQIFSNFASACHYGNYTS